MFKTSTLVRKYAVILLLLLSSGLTRLQAQTTLATGDISIIGFNMYLYCRGGFSFVTWVNLSAGTVIKFTDNGFNSANSALSSGNLRDKEQTLTWTTTSAIAAGTIINIEGNGSTAAYVPTTGTVSVKNSDGSTTPYMNLTTLGDQVFAFQGGTYSSSNTTTATMAAGTVMLYGISFQGNGSYSSWFTSGTPGSGDTYQPSELVNNSIYFGGNAVGGEYTGARTGMTIAQYKAAINNTANWTIYTAPNGVNTYNMTAFTLVSPPSITAQPSNSTVCASSNTTFSITASNASSYQWQVNTGSGFTNVSNGGVYSGATTATLTITGATASMNSYQYNCVATGSASPAATSNSATLTVNSTNTWLGGTSAAWNVSTNWGCGIIPTASTDVVIPSGTTYSPQVNITTAICNSLTINSGATLSFSGTTNILEVKGNITNNGTFTTTSGTLKLSGTSQSIPGLAYNNLTLFGTGTKTLAGSATISGTLTLTNGFLQLGVNNLTLTGTSSSASAVNPSSPTSYIITNSTGQLKIQNIGTGGRTGAVVFPVGTSSSSYTPVTITNTGTSDEFGARVINFVYQSYTTAGIPNGPVQNTYNVGKTWHITEATAGGSNATLNFGWNSTDEQPGFDHTACYPAHYFTSGWHSTATPVAASGSNPYNVSLSNVTSFSPFAVGSQYSILPLDLLSFTGKTNDGNTVLTWVTANEKAFAGFDVERSSDGRSYQTIGNVGARANNSSSQTTYTYTDATATAGNWYYRLKMTNNDGTVQYSTVVQINNSASRQATYSLQPNSVKGNQLNLVATGADAQDVQVRIIDAVGREWHKETIRASAMRTGKVSITTPALPLGMYYLQVRNGKTGTVQLLKFSKE